MGQETQQPISLLGKYQEMMWHLFIVNYKFTLFTWMNHSAMFFPKGLAQGATQKGPFKILALEIE